MKLVRLVLFLVLSPRIQERGGGETMVLTAVEAATVGSKPPAAFGVRSYTGERHDLGASAPLSTRASLMDFSGAGGSAKMPTLVKLVRPKSTLIEELSSFYSSSAAEPSVRLLVFMSVSTSGSMARCGYWAVCRSHAC